ncbi:MAG: hypothetical protein JRJ42_07185 [Deltaproteobacteria bacterium]|nr:hypothetical protein [Deltaproteobacteria bacterium]MBW2019319.1 hypothetical protein [Deltaproteobacteria bacterium]MBW2074367.1 hypothetical protein [Deltaproteobacteria bacterium]RLB82299.1 MAG: hypothetical protein DRH17_06225 [Deltaproteobacteria bacterium]
MKKNILLSVVVWLIVGCAATTPRKPGLQISTDAVEIDEKAVDRLIGHIAMPPVPPQKKISKPLQTLLTFLALTPPAKLVETRAHAQAEWRLDKIFLLDDCVAVQFSEGHYMETVFFVRNRGGWRITSRIRPEDHEY